MIATTDEIKVVLNALHAWRTPNELSNVTKLDTFVVGAAISALLAAGRVDGGHLESHGVRVPVFRAKGAQ